MRDDSSICAEKVVLYPFQRNTLQMTTLLNPVDRRSDEFALIQSAPISTQWTNELRRNIGLHPSCKLLTDLLRLYPYTRTVVYPFLIKGWSPRRIAERLKVSRVTIERLLEVGREQLKRSLEHPI